MQGHVSTALLANLIIWLLLQDTSL